MKRTWILFTLLFCLIYGCKSQDNTHPADRDSVKFIKLELPTPLPEPVAETENELKVQAPFLWKVVHDRGDSYLLGTIHQAVKADKVVNDALYSIISESKVVVFETDTEAIKKNPSEVMSLSQLPKEQTLKEMLSEERWAGLLTLVEGMPPHAIERMKPWTVITLATLIQIKKLNHFLERGMDDTIRRYAEMERRQIGFLEDWKESLQAGENAMTLQYLRDTIDEKDQVGSEFSLLLSSYLSGDEEKIKRLLKPETKSEEHFVKVLIHDRNQKWMKNLVPLLNKGNAFVAVGTAHLLGKKSLISHLKGKGFHVERVKSITE